MRCGVRGWGDCEGGALWVGRGGWAAGGREGLERCRASDSCTLFVCVLVLPNAAKKESKYLHLKFFSQTNKILAECKVNSAA